MTRTVFRIAIAGIFAMVALIIGAILLFPDFFSRSREPEAQQTRIVIPENFSNGGEASESEAELLARAENASPRVPLEEGEAIVSILNGNFDNGPAEAQFVAYRNLLEIESPIYLTYIEYDEAAREYKRLWSAQTAATRPGTVRLYTQDLLGDRSVCVLLSGMNGLEEHTLTAFRLTPGPRDGSELFSRIAELRIDGTIAVREMERSQAYQMGFGRGQSFTIAAYGRDYESANILDQVEIVYAHNSGNGLYEQTSRTRIPGTQIEQRRVRELLGNPRAFEEFIAGLWYHMTPQGTIDKRQYIYFNPQNREIIFYGDETQQVFNWQNSAATRYGLYVSSQNISVTTLRRSIDIELESLDSVKLRVFEDVRLKIGVNAPWDGSYRKAGPLENQAPKPLAPGNAHIDAYYDGPMGKIRFLSDGSYELSAGETVKRGKYSFFSLNDRELLEMRSDTPSGPLRETYLVETEAPADEAEEAGDGETEGAEPSLHKTLTLLQVRIGARGVERLPGASVTLTLASE